MTEAERQERIKAILTDGFLENLASLARLYGWEGDYVEVYKFAEWAFREAGKDAPDLQAYEIEYDDSTGN